MQFTSYQRDRLRVTLAIVVAVFLAFGPFARPATAAPGETVTIADASAFEDSAPGNQITFTVTRVIPDDTVPTTASFLWDTSDGTATAGTDYTKQEHQTLMFAANETTKTISVTITPDATIEADETFTVTLTAVDGTTCGDCTATGTIRTDEASLSVSNEQINESAAGNASTATMTFTITLSPSSPAPATVQWSTQDGTAVSNGGSPDFNAVAPTTVTFNVGETQKTVNVTVRGDTLDEPDETFVVRLTNSTNAAIVDDTGEGTIADDDAQPTISFATTTQGDEGPPTAAVFTATLSQASGRAVTFVYTTSTGTASSSDFTAASNAPATIPAGSTSTTIAINVTDDTVDEPNETFSVAFGQITNATSSGSTTAFATITDDDAPVVVSINDPTAVNEGNSGTSSIQFTVSLSAASEQSVDVDYATANGTATQPSDYTAIAATTLHFAAGTTSSTVNVTINGDTLDEGTSENFFVNLSNPSNATLSATDAQGTGTITDDDGAPVISVNSLSNITEGDTGTSTATFTVSLSNPSASNVTVNYATQAPGSGAAATANGDYTTASGTLTFTPGQTTQNVPITIIGDTVDEADESFVVHLSSPSANASIGTADGTGTIHDDDAGPALTVADASVLEGSSGTVQMAFVVTLAPSSQQTVTVDYATSDGNAVQPGDYTQKSTSLTFSPGQTQQTITVSVNSDTIPENNETFTVTLSNPNNATIARSTATGTINNDDAGTPATLSINSTSAAEGGTASFTITRSGNTTETVTVVATTNDGTAVAPGDYTTKQQTVTVPAGGATFTVSLASDTVYEGNETFTVTLTSPRNAAITNGGGTGTGTITDAQSEPTITVTGPGGPVAENQSGGATATFTLTLSGQSEAPVTVERQTADGTATAGTDYTGLSTAVVTFPSKTTTLTVPVAVIDDSTYENNQTFALTISNPTGATIAPGGGSANATITSEEVAPAVTITNGSVQEVDQGGTSVLHLTATLSGPSDETATVNWAAVAQTATAGTDYSTTSGALTFQPGVATSDVLITVVGDNVDEANETLRVDLLNSPAPTNATIGNPNQATGTIVDNDDKPLISVGNVTVAEGSSGTPTATFTVSLSAPATGNVTVTATTDNNGSAVAGSDYTAKTEQLTFTGAETTKQFTVAITPDTIDEASETFLVRLSAPSANAAIGTQPATGTITDDDAGPVLSIGHAQVTEGDSGTTPAVFTVTMSAASQQPILVDVLTFDDTAKAGSDYHALDTTLTFAPGETSKTVAVNVIGDDEVEDDEFFGVEIDSVRPDGSVASGANIGVGFLLDDDVAAPVDEPTAPGYMLAGADGKVYAFGVAHHGDLAGQRLNQPVIGLTMTPSGQGYWLVAKDGGIFTFGDAKFFGSMGGTKLNAPVLGMEATPTGRGYWLFGQDGGIFTFGDAKFFGSTGGKTLNAPVVGMETTADGGGYWLVAQDGGIFTFGNAPFHGSTGSMKLNQPVFDMAALGDGSQYWLVARDGGIFTFPGSGPFFGSAVGSATASVIGMGDTPTGHGYWIADGNGLVFAYGDAKHLGDLRGRPLTSPIVGFAALQ